MNIFIGVIGTQYEREQGIVCTTFQQHRAKCCLNFLLRARILPTCICSKLSAMLLSTTAAFGALVVQVVGITHGRVDYTPSIFVILQLIMLVAAYQNPEQAWAPAQDPSQQRFLWIIAPSEPEEVYDMELGAEDHASSSSPSIHRCFVRLFASDHRSSACTSSLFGMLIQHALCTPQQHGRR
eukprot:CAMPEP_0115336784 /NCGR_PEP_ID=MMETSP0270-20121206/89185_1 /TAXON_ID=71861 /ORGANISM="Scrippsiella trochoidea, Strain CCMP3099" /LENGTH=181 /DNA_ID=CAMNT_0002757969 /DNA_START=480 /DNA_END=1023 /DNA_ORIENTATION=-